VDTELDRPRYRATASYRIVPRAQIGLELNPAAGEVSPLATVFLLHEQARWPGMFVGTSSDRIGSPEGTQSYYLTAIKNLDPVPASAYASLNYSEWDDGWNVPFGAFVDIGRGFGVQPMYDGHRTHLLGTWQNERVSVSAMWVWLERAGLAVSFGF
jgi:hypothetical protein